LYATPAKKFNGFIKSGNNKKGQQHYCFGTNHYHFGTEP